MESNASRKAIRSVTRLVLAGPLSPTGESGLGTEGRWPQSVSAQPASTPVQKHFSTVLGSFSYSKNGELTPRGDDVLAGAVQLTRDSQAGRITKIFMPFSAIVPVRFYQGGKASVQSNHWLKVQPLSGARSAFPQIIAGYALTAAFFSRKKGKTRAGSYGSFFFITCQAALASLQASALVATAALVLAFLRS